MSRKDYAYIFEHIAAENHITVTEVRNDIEAAIRVGMANPIRMRGHNRPRCRARERDRRPTSCFAMLSCKQKNRMWMCYFAVISDGKSKKVT